MWRVWTVVLIWLSSLGLAPTTYALSCTLLDSFSQELAFSISSIIHHIVVGQPVRPRSIYRADALRLYNLTVKCKVASPINQTTLRESSFQYYPASPVPFRVFYSTCFIILILVFANTTILSYSWAHFPTISIRWYDAVPQWHSAFPRLRHWATCVFIALRAIYIYTYIYVCMYVCILNHDGDTFGLCQIRLFASGVGLCQNRSGEEGSQPSLAFWGADNEQFRGCDDELRVEIACETCLSTEYPVFVEETWRTEKAVCLRWRGGRI